MTETLIDALLQTARTQAERTAVPDGTLRDTRGWPRIPRALTAKGAGQAPRRVPRSACLQHRGVLVAVGLPADGS